MEAITSSPVARPISAPTRRAQIFVAPQSHLLVGQRGETLLSSAGSGFYSYDSVAVTRWTDDPTLDADGVYIYVRDLETGQFWSAGLQPTAAEPDEYSAEFAPHRARIRRADGDIELQLDVSLCQETGVELRRCLAINHGRRRRALEFTSYLEWVLQDAAADAAHPAFSKLFVETEFDALRRLIVARRRSRDSREPTLLGAHWIVADPDAVPPTELEFETSRAIFIGRGRTLRLPAALADRRAPSGATGPVLDAIGSLRQRFYLPPDESASITFALGARGDVRSLREVVEAMTANLAERTLLPPAGVGTGAEVDAPTERREGRRFDPAHLGWISPPLRFQRLREPSGEGASRDGVKPEPLQFDNGLGGFSPRGDEYVIRLRPDAEGRLQLPPAPWSHVVANPAAGFIATETGAGCTWTVNSRENRLTHWSNDPVCDPHAEAIYLRDRESLTYWSPTPGPAGPNVVHEVRYGFGYAQYEQTSAELRQRVVQFVPRDDAVKVIRISLSNLRPTRRSLDLFFYAHLALGSGSRRQSRDIRTRFDAACGSVLADNPARDLSHRVSFIACIAPTATAPISFTGDRMEFLGQYGVLAAPAAVVDGASLSGCSGSIADACAALQATINVENGQSTECWLLVGEADDEAEARRLLEQYSTREALDAALADVRSMWRDILGAVEIDTPSPSLNLMVNGWLPYQNLSCRLWGRSAYYQSGGAYGFRDQLQDAAAYVYHRPELTREQILRHAAAQFVEGDVLHWWHVAAATRGIRTRFADDLLWLPFVAAEYAATTGDASLWDEPAPYLTGPALEPGEAERYFTPTPSGETGTVYEHACRALDRSAATGVHGLPLMGGGDWNDGMNRVGAGGRGESVWMAFFLDDVLQRMIPVCEARGDEARAGRYRQRQRRLRLANELHGWDGEWFRRAYFDDGTPLGTAAADECQIDALVQAWAVLTGAADAERAAEAMAAVERRLVRDDARLIQLLDPPFDRMDRDPGYIKGYVPGVRENGGQYTHGALWYVRALAELGRGNRAVELLDMLNPINHARTLNDVDVYQVEPYVVAADVYSQPPHVGRGGWTWYTGSAGWMFRVAVESILGLQVRGGRELVLNPCISAAWPRCELRYRLPNGGGQYKIAIENPHGRERGVCAAWIDGGSASVDNGVARIPLSQDGKKHHVRLRL
jgi:cyclic beta-1,2-glucan synthetase